MFKIAYVKGIHVLVFIVNTLSDRANAHFNHQRHQILNEVLEKDNS